jgi:cellulose synthase/poly-beta-1,6-N-acetylglucosamine synthase-like glycosyltransferase
MKDLDRSAAPAAIRPAGGEYPVEILILARDESDVVGETIDRVRRSAAPTDRIHVVADHCQDRTAAVAREHGAIVHIRSGASPSGKGPAIRWWLERTRREPGRAPGVVILDADTLVEPEAITALRRRLSSGAPAVQAYVRPLLRASTVVGRLAALSETVEQQVYDVLRSRLGWPVRLRGTGMAFNREALELVAPRLQTSAEDVELTIRLSSQRIRTESCREAVVRDPKPPDENGAARQRARWLHGLLEVTACCRGPILRVVGLGPAGWSLLSSLFLKPRTLFFPLKVSLCAGLWLAAPGRGPWIGILAGGFTASTALEALGWIVGLRYIPERNDTLRALLHAPRFAAMWLRSASLLPTAGRRWLRARPVPGETVQGEAAGAE